MTRWGLFSCFLVIISVFVLTDPLIALSKEDTAYISLNRVGVSRHQADVYMVKKNDCLFKIIKKKYEVSKKEGHRILELVKYFNPQLKDLNVIYPGQKLLLPRKRPPETADAVRSSSNVLAEKQKRKVILKYVVKRGDTISGIIHGFGNSYEETYKVLEIVKRINPKIQNFDMIYPGQIIMFPGTSPGDTLLPTGSGDVSAPIPEYKDVTIPRHKMLPVIHHIINMMYGEIISDGNYCIPVPPSSEVKIDCSRVPVVEIENGNIILLDLSNRIPEDLKKVIEATWENYYVISAQKGEEISHMLERIINTSGVYEIEKVNRYEEIGNIPAVKVFVEFLASKKPRFKGTRIGSFAINFISKSSQLVPLPVRAYAGRNGLEIIEVMDGLGMAADEKGYQPCPMHFLESGSGIELAESLLDMLGYSPVKDSGVDIFIGEGLTLSVKADLLLNTDGGRIIITSSSFPDEVMNILQKKGDKVIFISKMEDRKEILEDIMRVMKIPFCNGNFKFHLSGHNEKECGDISFPALQMRNDEIFYLVDYDIDNGIYELLNKEWKVTLVRY